MNFESKLMKATILKRYKRFLSDIKLEDGSIITAHVPNTGSMKTCWDENWDVYISESNNPKRKLKYTLELTNNGNTLICVNTNLPNRIVKQALEKGEIQELNNYTSVIPEQKIFDSRLDFLLKGEGLVDTYVEVKNVTLLGSTKTALFPDSKSVRGQKHLTDLMKIVDSGNNAAMLYLINRSDVNSFSPADEIDPKYGQLLREAKTHGVKIMAYQTKITPKNIKIHQPIQIKL